jgi:hypothetical protein
MPVQRMPCLLGQRKTLGLRYCPCYFLQYQVLQGEYTRAILKTAREAVGTRARKLSWTDELEHKAKESKVTDRSLSTCQAT